MPMSTGSKVSSLECKYVFRRPEHKAKEGAFGIEFEDFEMRF